MKEIDPIRNAVLDDHPLGIALKELGRRPLELVGDQKSWFFMPQIIDDHLPKFSLIAPQLIPAVQNPIKGTESD
jgi:hypothetical protein